MFERTLQALRHPRTHLGAAREQLAYQANRALWHAAEIVGVTSVLGAGAERRFCARPFCHFEVKHDGNVYLCNSALVPLPAGNLRRSTPEEVWSSRTARAIRRAILDGSFAFCNKASCRFLRGGLVPRAREVTDERLRAIMDRGLTRLPHGPREVNAGYDRTCNLACPSCRRAVHAASGTEAAEARRIQDAILSWARFADVEHLTLAGSGDPFGSPVYRDFLRGFDPARFPGLKLRLHTNGLLFTESMWASMPGVAGRLQEMRLSVDAATAETYARIHPGGDFAVLLRNMEFAGALRRAGHMEMLTGHFCAQADNFRELPRFVDLCKRLGFNRIRLKRMLDWGTMTPEVFRTLAVHRRQHPQHEEFLRIMADPALRDPIVVAGNLSEFLPGQPWRSRPRRRYSLTVEDSAER